MDRHPRACWFAAIPGAQKAKDLEDCLKNMAAPPLNIRTAIGTAVSQLNISGFETDILKRSCGRDGGDRGGGGDAAARR